MNVHVFFVFFFGYIETWIREHLPTHSYPLPPELQLGETEMYDLFSTLTIELAPKLVSSFPQWTRNQEGDFLGLASFLLSLILSGWNPSSRQTKVMLAYHMYGGNNNILDTYGLNFKLIWYDDSHWIEDVNLMINGCSCHLFWRLLLLTLAEGCESAYGRS